MNLLECKLTIDDLIAKITAISPDKLPIIQLHGWIEQLTLNDRILKPHILFSHQCYQRQRLYQSPLFEILMLCWQPGQSTTIHDHHDSLNVTRVYQGILTSRLFESKGTSLSLIREDCLEKDELASVDRYQIHQLANTSKENLVTLSYLHQTSTNSTSILSHLRTVAQMMRTQVKRGELVRHPRPYR